MKPLIKKIVVVKDILLTSLKNLQEDNLSMKPLIKWTPEF